jgi:hypothetical protein
MATLGNSTITTLSLLNALGVADGGTGAKTFTSGAALIGNGTGAFATRSITNNTSATAVTASTNLITANTLYYHKGNSNIVTVGTITSGTWQGTAIANAYLANSKVTVAGKDISLGGSLSAADLKAALGLNNVSNTAASGYLTALSSNTTNAVSITVGGTTKNITASTMKTSLGLGSLAYLSSISASSITQGYLNTHPENSPIIVPFINNDLAFLNKKGGSYKVYKTTSTDYTAASLSEAQISISGGDNMFDGSPSYAMISTTGEYVAVIDMTLHKTFAYSNVFYIDFGSTSWRAKNISVYVMNADTETKYTKYLSVENNAKGNVYGSVSHTSTNSSGTTVYGFNRLRVVLSGFNGGSSSSGKRIAQVGLLNYGSAGVTETYISRGGCDGIYGSLVPHTTNSFNLGSSSKKWANVYATTFNGNATSATKATQDGDGNVITTTYAKIADVSDLDIFAGMTLKTGVSTKTHSGWDNTANQDKIIPTMNFIAYWNGAYNASNGSNLTYCVKGAFGDAAIKAVTTSVTSGSTSLVTSGGVYTALASYLPLTGGTLAGTSQNTPLTIKGTASGNDAWIAFHNNSGFLASLGVSADKKLKIYTNSASYNVWTAANQGSGSGLDADTLDGYHASSFSLAHDHNYLPLAGGTISGVLCVGQTMSQYAASRAQFSVVSSSTEPAMIWLGSNKERKWSVESRGSSDDYAFSLYSWVNATHVLRIKHDGNVGIGTTSPSYKLHVGGSFNATTIYENGTRVLTGITSKMVTDALGYTPIENETDISGLATKSELSNYVSKIATGVQSIAGGLVVGASRDDSQAVGRIMLTGSTNPLIGIRATGGTAFYFQSTGDIMYLGPTSSRAMAFTGSTGDVSFPGNVTIGTTSSNKNLTVNGEVTAKKFNGTASDSNKLGGRSLTSDTNNYWNGVVHIGTDGVMEVGKYIDFHNDTTNIGDFSTRLQCTGNHTNTVSLPSESGTLALTKDLPDTSSFVKTSGNNTFTGKNIFTATATFNTPETQKFVVGDSSSAFVFGSDGLQCFSGTSSTSAKVMYMNYYGGAVYIGKDRGTQEIGLRGTVTANGVAVATTNDLSRYLLLTGGTMSGNITFPSGSGIYESTRHLLSSSTSSTYVGNQDVKTVLRAGAGLYADINGTRHAVIHAGNIGDYIIQDDGDSSTPDASTYAFINGSNALGTWPISISGTAESCNHAANDGEGNNIASTYLKKSGDTFTGTVTFKYDTPIKTREHGTSYDTGWMNCTAGNEALAFIADYDITSFMFVQGHSTKMDSWTSSTWQSVTPAMQIKMNSVYINSLIANGVTPEYKFYVNGISAFNGNVSVTGNISASGTIGGSLASSLTVFGKAYNNSGSITIADTDLVASLTSGDSVLTDNSEILTSYASNNGFSDSSGKNKIYKRKALRMYDYIKGKTDSVYIKRDGSNTITGNLTLMVSESHDSDQFIRFKYSSTDLDNYSWRLGYIGSGSGNENNFVIQSNHNGAWNSALKIGLQQYDATFKGNVTAPKFIGELQGNASSATSSSSASIALNGNFYGVCDTDAATFAKTVEIDGFPSTLKAGTRVTIKFTYASTNTDANNPMTLNVSGTGAYIIYRYGTTLADNGTTTSGWIAGAVQTFTFDGNGWVREYWSNTTYSNVSLGQGYATCSTAAATTAKTASLSSYALTTGGIVSVKFTYDVPAGATLNINSKGAKAIYYRGSAITAGVIKAGDTATFIYSTNYHLISVDKSINTAMHINSSGNVTIGDSDLAGSDYKLVVNGLSRFKNNVESEGNIIGAGAVQAKTSAHGFVSLQVGSTGNKGLLDSRTSWIIYTDGTNTLLPQGNVGIGTTSPTYKLQVNGTSRFSDIVSVASLRIVPVNGSVSADFAMDESSLTLNRELKFTNVTESDICRGIAAAFKASLAQTENLIARNIILGASSGSASNLDFNFQKYTSISNDKPRGLTTLMTLTTDGNLGIGTTSPAYKLDVNGTARISGAVTMSSSLTVDGNITANGVNVQTEIIYQTEPSVTIQPNVYNKWNGTCTSLTLQFATPVNVSIINNYMFEFTAASTGCTVSLPSTVKWQNGAAPTIAPGCTYQVSITDSGDGTHLAVCSMFK